MGKHLVLVGGGHAHMVALANLRTFVERGDGVTVIGPSPYHYYSGMGPGMLGKTYSPDEIRFATRDMVEKQGGTFILDWVQRIDPDRKQVYLESGNTVVYDVISFNTGSYVPDMDAARDDDRVFSVKPIEKLMKARERILALVARREIDIGIIGGGPSAVEIAGNIWRLIWNSARPRARISIFSGNRIMSQLPGKVRDKAIKSLAARGIEILENTYVNQVRDGQISLASGETRRLDLVFMAMGVKPSPIFKTSGLPTGPDGGLRVNKYLQCPQYPDIFGGGDCIYFDDRPLDKVGVYAVRENPVLYHNLLAALTGNPLKPFEPGGGYLQVFNMGDDTGILLKNRLLMGGRFAFIIKDFIDRRFMRKFKSI